jgi:hypothetical protein
MAATQKQIEKLASESAFVFVGEVMRANAATMEGLAGANTAIVKVSRVLTAPEMFQGIEKQNVTVRTKGQKKLAKGLKTTFFANGWIFGSSLALDVVGTADEADTKSLAARPRGIASSSASDADISRRLQSAELGIVGTVASIAKSAAGTTHISEHDPVWHEASLSVDEVIKGSKSVKNVSVLFPQSDDVRWHKVEKYQVGQKGIFLLQDVKKQDMKGIHPKQLAAVPAGTQAFTALHPADYLPMDDLARVRALAGK